MCPRLITTQLSNSGFPMDTNVTWWVLGCNIPYSHFVFLFFSYHFPSCCEPWSIVPKLFIFIIEWLKAHLGTQLKLCLA